MKKTIIKTTTGIGTALGSLFVAGKAYALDPRETLGFIQGPGGNAIATNTDIVQILFIVLEWVLVSAFAFAVGMLVVGGFRYIASAGNEGQVEAAKEMITQAIFGLVIILLAFVIASTINVILLGQF